MYLSLENEKLLNEAFVSICNMSFADSENNHSTCGVFHIKPFSTHWDKKTVDEVIQHVRIYIDTWVISRMEQVLGKDKKDIEKASIERYNKKYPIL